MIQTKELKNDAVEVRYNKYEVAINQHDQLKHELFNLWNEDIKNSREWYEVYTELAYYAGYTPMDYHDFIGGFKRYNPTVENNEKGMLVSFINICIRY